MFPNQRKRIRATALEVGALTVKPRPEKHPKLVSRLQQRKATEIGSGGETETGTAAGVAAIYPQHYPKVERPAAGTAAVMFVREELQPLQCVECRFCRVAVPLAAIGLSLQPTQWRWLCGVCQHLVDRKHARRRYVTLYPPSVSASSPFAPEE
ncbi:hypothetical protein QOT17_005170 [Balamuthia mandrillaris]